MIEVNRHQQRSDSHLFLSTEKQNKKLRLTSIYWRTNADYFLGTLRNNNKQ